MEFPMPDTAVLCGEILCPVCGTQVLDSIRCQWGMVPGARYEIGDPVAWLRDATGQVIRPFTLVNLDGKWHWNCGDPSFANVAILDEDVYPGNVHVQCHACKTVLAAGIAIVRNNR